MRRHRRGSSSLDFLVVVPVVVVITIGVVEYGWLDKPQGWADALALSLEQHTSGWFASDSSQVDE